MTAREALEILLKSYKRYYNIQTEDVTEPFAAEAVFHSHDEQYFLVKSARLSEAESHEYVFFAAEKELTPEKAKRLDQAAWEAGLARTEPSSYHRNTDITLIVLAERIDAQAGAYLKKSRHYQSYRFGLQGWNGYRAVAMELSTGALFCNRRGRDLKKLFRNIKTNL